MKIKLKSALKCMPITLFLLLCSCAQEMAWLTGEPGPEITGAASFVKKPEESGQVPWPNLADVPTIKPVFSDSADVEQTQEELLSDYYKAEAQAARMQSLEGE